jgi:hypothetical protein
MPAEEIPVSAYPSRLLNRVEVAEGTMAFHFEKPAGFDFKPGRGGFNPPAEIYLVSFPTSKMGSTFDRRIKHQAAVRR